MSMETDLIATLTALCPRVYPDVAPAGTTAPFVVWQALGGEPINALDNAPADKRNTYLQISVWGQGRMSPTTLIRQIEDALRGSAAFVATPMGEALSTYEPDTQLYGSIQRFSIWAAR